MFFAAILSPPFPFVQKFAGRNRAALKKSTLKSGKISTHPVAKIFVQQFVPELAPPFLAMLVMTFTQSFDQMFIPTLVKMSAQHCALMFG
jgi:hypothetical protein